MIAKVSTAQTKLFQPCQTEPGQCKRGILLHDSQMLVIILYPSFTAAMFVAQPLQKVRGTAGKDVMLMCRLVSSDERPPNVAYEWFRGERRNSNDFKLIPGEKSNILRLSSEFACLFRAQQPGSNLAVCDGHACIALTSHPGCLSQLAGTEKMAWVPLFTHEQK